jgi:hypothetical protein
MATEIGRTDGDGLTAALFPLGQVVATPGALTALYEAKTLPAGLLQRHQSGDWGDVGPADADENRFSVKHDFRIISAYVLETGIRIWIITEADRSATTLLLPSEY